MIENVSEKNLDELLPLIRDYQEFYKVADISDSRNKSFFSQFGESNPLGCQFLFRQDNDVVGFATVYFTFSSTIAAKVGVLNDLYTIPTMRGKGIGRKLIEHCHEYAKKNGAVRLQWITAPDNEQAQSLYDSIETNKSPWLLYNISS
ncbi:MAG: GNAT family N-acetyltransferase [Nitrospinales bacterium]